MRSCDFGALLPAIELAATAVEAARLLDDQNLLGLVVKRSGRPVTTLTGTQVRQLIVEETVHAMAMIAVGTDSCRGRGALAGYSPTGPRHAAGSRPSPSS